jgi:hypothetical protein
VALVHAVAGKSSDSSTKRVNECERLIVMPIVTVAAVADTRIVSLGAVLTTLACATCVAV